jgi:predicted ATP-grasp superfamily ATP-dependent carboligase
VFDVCRQLRVSNIYFIGSVAGIIPHTRESRITYSSSDEKLKNLLEKLGISPVNYQGPAHIVTSLMVRAVREKMSMITLVAEIPAYVDGYNPRCVETTVKCMAQLADLQIEIDDLRRASASFEKKLGDLVETQPTLAEKVKKLEEDYDRQAFDRELSDLSDWMGDRGLRVD